MGKELEYKLQVESEEALLQILHSDEISTLVDGAWREIPMKTTYYDNAERQFTKLHWTFRHRMEGETSVVCLKTPHADAHTRNEWQVEAPELNEAAVISLIEAGAPKGLLMLYGTGELTPLCGAKFLRRCVMLRLSDGSRVELAGDIGLLHGESESMPLSELELELYEGEAAELRKFAEQLCQRYHLHEQPMSKFARAKTLK